MKTQTALIALVLVVGHLAVAAGPVAARKSENRVETKDSKGRELVIAETQGRVELMSAEQAQAIAKKAETVLGFENPNLSEMIQKSPDMGDFVNLAVELFQKGSKRTKDESDMLTSHMEVLRVLGKNRVVTKLTKKEKEEISFAKKYVAVMGKYVAYGRPEKMKDWAVATGAELKSGALLTQATINGAKKAYNLKGDNKEVEKFIEDVNNCRLMM